MQVHVPSLLVLRKSGMLFGLVLLVAGASACGKVNGHRDSSDPISNAAEAGTVVEQPTATRACIKLDGIRGRRACFSQNGMRLLVVGDEVAELWDTTTWRRVRSFIHGEGLSHAVLDAQAKHLLTVGGRVHIGGRSEPSDAKLWSAQTGELLLPSIRHKEADVHHAAISPDGCIVATSNNSSDLVYLWNAETGELERTIDHKDHVLRIEFDHKGSTLVTASGVTKLWDVSSGTQRATLTGGWMHDSPPPPSISASGHIVVASDAGFIVYQIDNTKPILKQDYLLGLNMNMMTTAISPDGSHVAVTSTVGGEVWRVRTGETPIRNINVFVRPAVFDLGGEAVVFLGFGDNCGVWDVQTGRRVRVFSDHERPENVAFSPDGKWLVLVGHNVKKVIAAQSGKAGAARWVME